MSFADAVKATRKRAFMSQETFAKEIGSSFPSINRWENNRGKPSLNTMKKIKEFCNKNDLPYEEIEKEWIGCSEEK